MPIAAPWREDFGTAHRLFAGKGTDFPDAIQQGPGFFAILCRKGLAFLGSKRQ
jgi:hypothetical protein